MRSLFNSGRRRILAALLTAVLLTGVTFAATTIPEYKTTSIWPESTVPTVTSEKDSSSAELGMKFRSSTATTVTGVKFYKGEGNTGTHTGSLWSAEGEKLATVQFANETATGWQTAFFAKPVSIEENTTYVISYHAPNGYYAVEEGYFARKSVTNGTITALQNGTDGGNGVYAYSDNVVFPTSTYNASNYWVDVIVKEKDTTPPSINISAPAHNSNVTGTVEIVAEASDDSAVTSVQFKLNGADLGAADTTAPYSFPWSTAAYKNGKYTLTATATDSFGNQTQSSEVVVTVTNQVNAGLWPSSAKPNVLTDTDTGGVELGLKFRSTVATTITGVKFYKSSDNTGVHIGSLWSRTGVRLASVVFDNESPSGWQVATFASPVAIDANTTYIVSYFAPNGRYSSTSNYFANASYTTGSIVALQNGIDGGNGVYKYGNSSDFPNNSYNATNYWVDVITGQPPADTTAPTVTNVTPANNATNVNATTNLNVTVSESLDAATVSSSSVTLRDEHGDTLTATVTYNDAQKRITLSPLTTLDADTMYTATLTTALKDVAGNALAANYVWSFTTAPDTSGTVSALATGHGGPILLITKTGQPFTEYYSEILRAEGLNSYDAVEIGGVTSAVLDDHEVVVLGDMALTTAQVSLLTNWVNDGGNLIAMHPDKKLAGLMGITDQAATLSDAYLRVNTATAPGSGITDQTIQFHGSADRYSVNAGTTTVASLYTTSSTSTASPVVTMRSVGSNGGQAVAFTYDLARSVVYTHQGNPAWSGQDRDGDGIIRSNDLFYGAMTGDVRSDYVDLSKVAIPQADEQQRLLANIIQEVNKDNQPLPRLSYLPYNDKAVVVLAADDHATGNGITKLNYQIAQSAPGCTAADWECVRSTTLMYVTTPMTNNEAANFYAQGFDFGTHMVTGPTCENWTMSSLSAAMTSDIATFRAKYTSLPAQHVNRIHCISWSDYVSAAKAEAANGLRIDMNYYYWPGSWVQNRPGFMTGSGLNMRFADTDGSMIDTFQLPSHLVDESGQTFPQNITTMLDRALGPEGYYAILGTHYDYSDTFDEQLIQAAKARNVRLVSGQQILDWTDGRNDSYFTNASWSGSTYSFTATIDAKLRSMGRALIPMESKNGVIQSITRNGTPVTYTTETMKGISYAIVPVTSGTYSVVYAYDTTPPTVSSVTPAASSTGAALTVSPKLTFSEPLTGSTVTTTSVRLLNGATVIPASVTYNSGDNSVTIDPTTSLSSGTTYTIHVSTSVQDTHGNALASVYTSTFTTGETAFSLWAPAPQSVSYDLDRDMELGIRFRASQDGTITKILFQKSPGDVLNVHTVTLWDENGVSKGTALTTNETASGWQTATFQTPIAITANTTYTASYHAPNGAYAYTSASLGSGFTNGPLTALVSGGVYALGGGYPIQSFNNANYWVDDVFVPAD